MLPGLGHISLKLWLHNKVAHHSSKNQGCHLAKYSCSISSLLLSSPFQKGLAFPPESWKGNAAM